MSKYNLTVSLSVSDITQTVKFYLKNVEVEHLDWNLVFKHEYSKELKDALENSFARWQLVELRKAAAKEINKKYYSNYEWYQLNIDDIN